MSRQYWVAAIPPFHTADGTAYTGTAAIGDISPAPSIVIPANYLEVGQRLEFKVFGRYTSTGTPGTAILGIYIGTGAIASGQAVFATAATTVGTSKTNQTWTMSGEGSVRAVGSGTSATLLGVGEAVGILGAAAADVVLAPLTAPAVLTFDSTIANKVMVGVTPSVTTGSWQTHYFTVRVVN